MPLDVEKSVSKTQDFFRNYAYPFGLRAIMPNLARHLGFSGEHEGVPMKVVGQSRLERFKEELREQFKDAKDPDAEVERILSSIPGGNCLEMKITEKDVEPILHAVQSFESALHTSVDLKSKLDSLGLDVVQDTNRYALFKDQHEAASAEASIQNDPGEHMSQGMAPGSASSNEN